MNTDTQSSAVLDPAKKQEDLINDQKELENLLEEEIDSPQKQKTKQQNDGVKDTYNKEKNNFSEKEKTKETKVYNEKQDLEKNHDVAAFAWTLVFAPILLVMRRDSRFILHHTRQAIILFIVGGVIFALPKPYSHLNILTLAVAVAGFLNANLSRWWKVPFLYDLVQKGLSPGQIATWIKNFIFKIFSIIGRMFTSGPSFAIRGTAKAISKIRGLDNLKLNSKIEELQQEKKGLINKANFLEKELLIEKYLCGELVANLNEAIKEKTKLLRDTIFRKGKKGTELTGMHTVHFINKDKEIILGNIDESGLFLFVNFTDNLKKIKFDVSFGDWKGIGIMFANINEAMSKLEQISQKFWNSN